MINEEIIKYLKEGEKKVLLLFDGIDELPHKENIMLYLKIEQVFDKSFNIRKIFSCRQEEIEQKQKDAIFQ